MEDNKADRSQPILVGLAVLGMLLLALGLMAGGFVPRLGEEEGPPGEAPAGLHWEHRNGKWIMVDGTPNGDKVWHGDSDVVPIARLLQPANIALAVGAIVFLLAMFYGAGQLGHKEVVPVAHRKPGETPAPSPMRTDLVRDEGVPYQPTVALTRTPPGAQPRKVAASSPSPVRRLPPEPRDGS